MKLLLWVIAPVLLMTSADLQAYLDPGTGSMLLQVILGGVAAIGIAFKLFWYKIKVALGMARKPESEDELS